MLHEQVLQVRDAVRRTFADDGVQPLPPLFAFEVVNEQGLELAEELLDPVQIVGVNQRTQQVAQLAVLVVDSTTRRVSLGGCRARFFGGSYGCGRTCHRRALLAKSRTRPRQENLEAPRKCGP